MLKMSPSWLLNIFIFLYVLPFIVYSQCLNHQRSLLVELKKELKYNSSISTKVSQWNQTSNDCCKWGGVECDAGGLVISLQLNDEGISGGIEDPSSSLFKFKHLKKLNLAFNEFNFTLPRSIRNLKYLSQIDLTLCSFTGSFPSILANLTELVYVDLSGNNFVGSIPSTMFNGGFRKLENLNLAFNSFSGHVPHSLFTHPSLSYLQLDSNNFTGQFEEFASVNVSKIAQLNLDFNRLEGPIPDSVYRLESLVSLGLSYNFFNGSFKLEKIRRNNLISLDLSGNSLTVDVGNNNSSWYRFHNLKLLGLSSCNLSLFPDFSQHSANLHQLDLADNRIGGEIPRWIWGKELFFLNLSNNLLTGFEKPYHIPFSLGYLDLRHNQLKGELSFSIPSKSHLELLVLANNSFSGSLPASFCNPLKLLLLDISDNILSGTIPPCLVENIQKLVLRGNRISGRIPDNFPLDCRLQYLDLNNNTLEGKIPKSLKFCKSLETMNVGNNLIHDTFPCMLAPSLRLLVLRSNRFHGALRCHRNWTKLQILDISSNNFSGDLKSINFSSWRAMMQGSHAYMLYNWNRITFDIKGTQRDLYKILNDFLIVDFSCNGFYGEIPSEIADLSALHYLNLSHNAFNGSIPKSLGKLGDLESLDLSRNHLTGAIPVELAQLTFLSFLNLSYNNLVREIPKGRQLQTFPADSFIGNPGLCGFNLNISCSSHIDDDVDEDEDEDKAEIEWKYVFAALGWVVGSVIIFWLYLFSPLFRWWFLDKIQDFVDDALIARDRRRRLARIRKTIR